MDQRYYSCQERGVQRVFTKVFRHTQTTLSPLLLAPSYNINEAFMASFCVTYVVLAAVAAAKHTMLQE